MNRNVESHFSELPHTEVQRSIFDRSHGYKATANVGDLIPFFCEEILPGDSVKITTSKVVRLQTLLTPIMDNMWLDTYYFFVPNRLIWSHWKEFMGENTQSAWLPQTEYFMPQFIAALPVSSCTNADYFGLPLGFTHSDDDVTAGSYVDCLRFRALTLIWNEYFRDENLQDPAPLDISDSDLVFNPLTPQGGGVPFKACKAHDYFSSALPAPQRGPSVTLPIGGDINLSGSASVSPQVIANSSVSSVGNSDKNPIIFQRRADSSAFYGVSSDFSDYELSGTAPTEQTILYPANLRLRSSIVDTSRLSVDVSDATMASVNDIRLAFQLQKFYEVNARSGSRYIETIKAHFNVSSPDARLQRPEYLGGDRVPLSIHQVTNNAQSSDAKLGNVGAMSLTTDVSDDVEKSFTEHGYVIGVCCVRYNHSYQNGVDRSWMRRNATDFYWPVFSNLGERPIKNGELYWSNTPATDTAAFGYQEAWAEYRYSQDVCAGEFRSDASNTLDSWHLADDYASLPTLSSSWIQEDKSNVDRVLAVTSSVSNQFFFDFYIKNIMTRPMPMYSIPGLIDHM